MFTTWLRTNRWAAAILTVLRVYLGWEFLNAGLEKLTGAQAFSAAGFLAHAVKSPVLGPDKSPVYPWYNSFIQHFALPHIGAFNFLVPWGELLVGIGLILGTLTTAAVFFGMMMNFAYMLAGTVSSNPMDILIGTFIIVAGYNAGKLGGDYFIIPLLRKTVQRLWHHEVALPTGKNGKAAQ